MQYRDAEFYALDFDQISHFVRFLILANESIAVEEKQIDESMIDDKKPVLDMYKASIKEYETRVRFAKNDDEKLAFLKVLDTLREDIKKFSLTEEGEQ